MKALWKTPDAEETYFLNTAEYDPQSASLRIQAFCHSFLFHSWKNKIQSRPYFMAAIILKGENRLKTPDGGIIRHSPGWFSISDLNSISGNISQNPGTLERYFILFEVTPLLRTLLTELFPSELPEFQLQNPRRLLKCFEEIRDALDSHRKADDQKLAVLAFELFLEAARQRPKPAYPEALCMALSYIDNHFKEHGLDRSRIAAAAGVGISTLGKLFRRHLNSTVQERMTAIRLEKAKNMLSFSSLPISEIADECGFSYSYYFAREFKKHFGVTPLKYRGLTSLRPN